MSIVPSGKVRLMKTQQLAVPQDETAGATQTKYVADKNKQTPGKQPGQQPPGEEVPDQQNAEPSQSPIAKIPDMKNQQAAAIKGKPVDPRGIQKAVDPTRDTDEDIRKNIQNIHGFKQSFLEWVTGFGIDTQQITRDKTKRKMMEQMFNIIPVTGKGRIEIPGWYTDAQGQRLEVEYSDAYNTLNQMARKFDFKVIPSKVTLSTDTYAFDVVPSGHGAITPNVSRNGLEALYAPEGGEGAHDQTQKAAFTQKELIKESREDLLDALLKLGIGAIS